MSNDLAQAGYIGPDGIGHGNTSGPAGPQLPGIGAVVPLGPHLYPPVPYTAPPASTEPPEWVKQLAPVIIQQATKVAQSFAESKESRTVLDYQEADAARRDSKGQQLVSHSVAIANLAHALGDMKETKARTEATSALEMAISRLASACVPVVEEKEPEPLLSAGEKQALVDIAAGYAQGYAGSEDGAFISALLGKLCGAWKMTPTPGELVAEERAGG